MREKLFKYRSITKGWGQKIVPFILFLAALPVRAQEVVLSSPLPGTQQSVSGIGPYVKTAFPFFLTVVAGLALVYITWGGILYATSLSSDRKQAGKDHIANALIGLVLAFLAVLILTTINPNLVNLSLPGLQSRNPTTVCDGVPGTGDPDCSGVWECDPNNLAEYGCGPGEGCESTGAEPFRCVLGEIPISACPAPVVAFCGNFDATCAQRGTGSFATFSCQKNGNECLPLGRRADLTDQKLIDSCRAALETTSGEDPSTLCPAPVGQFCAGVGGSCSARSSFFVCEKAGETCIIGRGADFSDPELCKESLHL